MNITSATVAGMTPQEKEIYFKHMEKRHKEEAIKIADEKAAIKSYKEILIHDILDRASDRFTYEALKAKDVRTLERIYDYC